MMRAFWDSMTTLVEAFCNFAFSIIVFFMVILLFSPLINKLRGHSGIWWVLLTLIIMVGLNVLVRLMGESFIDVIDKVRKGDLLAPLFTPLRNVTSVIGIYGVFKLEYFFVHNPERVMGLSWGQILWKFLFSL